MVLCCLTLFLAGSRSHFYEYRCDRLELNTVLSEDTGQIKFEQVILWRLCERTGAWLVAEYWIMTGQKVRFIKRLNGRTTAYVKRWQSSFAIECDEVRVTWTTNDPEVDNRKLWPQRFRQPVFKALD